MKVTSCLYCQHNKLDMVTHRSDGVGILRCQNCKVMMVDEIKDDTASLYTKEYFEKSEETSQGYATYMSSPTANLYGKYAFAQLFSQGDSHVDLGSADGSLMEIFYQNGYKTVGLEISNDAVEATLDKGLEAYVTNLHTFPSDTPEADVVTAYDLLEHADRPDLVLKNVHGILSKNGVFVFSTLAVTKYDITDYWFNNSLEHYIYYDKESLTNILTENFGAGRFGFVEEVINGVSEFWGFATTGDAAPLIKIMDGISKYHEPTTSLEAYYTSLFYNQISRFKESEELIEKHKAAWTDEQKTVAIFLNNYVQGRLERAIELTKDAVLTVPSINGIFWRGYYQALHDLDDIKSNEMRHAYDTEILSLREDVFRLNAEINNLRGSRVVGRIIRARDKTMGSILPAIKKLPKKTARGTIHNTKRAIGVFLPMETKITIGHQKRRVLNYIRGNAKEKDITEHYVDNELWRAAPLVSIVIPYYNRADTIDETMRSLLGQTFTNFEVIVVNDGSSDNVSKKKFLDLKNEYKSLKPTLIQQENNGVASARNNGISHSKGKYIICLDSDDWINPTYVEKAVTVLETDHDVSLVTSYRKDFGARNEVYEPILYDAKDLIRDNMVTTASVFRREAWQRSRGFLSDIGYEDWEFWLQLAENGDWGKTLREPLFNYRVAIQSRFVEDRSIHWKNISVIKNLHGNYRSIIKKLNKSRQSYITYVRPESALINLNNITSFSSATKRKKILIVIPWMTFGGAETLLYNFCRPLKETYDIAFVTGEESLNEWEYKFREITDKIFHLPQLLKDRSIFGEYVANYVSVHKIDVVHIVHSGYLFDHLPLIKQRNPDVNIVVTMFNDRVDSYVEKSIQQKSYIDSFNTDSKRVAESFKDKFNGSIIPKVIPNGIDCHHEFSPELFDRAVMREKLGLSTDDKAILFFGRLSQEKNPDVFIEVANEMRSNKKMKFFLIGDGPMREKCEQLVAKYKEASVTMLGYKSNVGEYLSAMDIFILPSAIEGFPLSILEAYAMGVSVIASDVGAITDVVKNDVNGYVVAPGSVSEIVSALGKLENNKKRAAIGKNNRRDAEEKYSIEQLGAHYNQLYRGVFKK